MEVINELEEKNGVVVFVFFFFEVEKELQSEVYEFWNFLEGVELEEGLWVIGSVSDGSGEYVYIKDFVVKGQVFNLEIFDILLYYDLICKKVFFK